ncbi:MAG: FAD-dependent thymidylate synthase [Microgenomates group bacterium]
MAEKYVYEKTSARETGFAIMSCSDTETGIVVRTPLASDKRSYPSSIAYVGAKFSRSRDGLRTLMGEVEQAYKQGKLTPEGRLASIVSGLKHQSPGGMAHVALSFENIPIMTAATVFRTTTLHDGQESSTRFINFSEGNVLPELATLLPEGVDVGPNLNDQYKQLEKMAMDNYLSWFPRVFEAYRAHFKINIEEKKEMDALAARTYDTVRGFLLSGFRTSMVYVTNATTMQQWLANFLAERLPGEGQLARVTMALLSPETKIKGYVPEIKPLLNHVAANLRTKEEQVELEQYLSNQQGYRELLSKRKKFEGIKDNKVSILPVSVSAEDQIVAQQLLVLHPSLNLNDAIKFASGLTDKQKAEIGRIMFSRRNRFYLPAMASSGGTISSHYEIDLGIERDVGRHRAHERVSPIHETFTGLGEIEYTGFTQAAYLRQIPEMKEIQKGMEADSLKYYEKRSEFLEKLSQQVGVEAAEKVGIYLLPLMHQVDMVMHADVRNMIHLGDIRIREGAHIDARLVTASANRQLAARDPLYSSLAFPEDRVKVDNREQFISRD